MVASSIRSSSSFPTRFRTDPRRRARGGAFPAGRRHDGGAGSTGGPIAHVRLPGASRPSRVVIKTALEFWSFSSTTGARGPRPARRSGSSLPPHIAGMRPTCWRSCISDGRGPGRSGWNRVNAFSFRERSQDLRRHPEEPRRAVPLERPKIPPFTDVREALTIDKNL